MLVSCLGDEGYDMPDKLPHTEVAIDPVEETDDAVQALADTHGCALLAFVAPYYGIRVTPVAEAYATIGVQEEFGIESFVERCRRAKINGLHLLVNSPGGSVVSSYKVARALRLQFKKIRVFVPHVAASGATLIALTGNEIVMGLMSHLTPLDLQAGYKGGLISSNTFPAQFRAVHGSVQEHSARRSALPVEVDDGEARSSDHGGNERGSDNVSSIR
jgi:hypothetical protein